jgi:plasmid stability protein
MLALMKITVDLDPDLYRAIKVEAARADRSVREITEAALRAWLEASEEAEDRESAAAALEEYRRDGGESAEAWFGRLAAETTAAYTSGPPKASGAPDSE